MALWAKLGAGGQVTLVGAVAAVVGAGSYFYNQAQRDLMQGAPVVVAPAPAPEVAAEPAPEPDVGPTPPGFDVVRVAPGGGALVAGQAFAGATVLVQLDGAEAATAQADPNGKFVALFDVAPSPEPRVLSLLMELADGTKVASADTVILAPVAAPVPQADPAPQSPAAAAPPQAPAVLLADDAGVTVLQPAQPAAPAQSVVIDAISYGAQGAVVIAGRGAVDSVVRLYLDNRFLVEVPVGDDSTWELRSDAIAPGLYTLRADQIAADGTVSARFETPFKREAFTQLAQAAPVPPAPVPPAPTVDPAQKPDVGTEDAPAPVRAAQPPEPQDVPASSAPEPAQAPPVPQVSVVTVQPGASLWRIANEAYGDGLLYVQLYEANKDQIKDPDLIYPGQIFELPK